MEPAHISLSGVEICGSSGKTGLIEVLEDEAIHNNPICFYMTNIARRCSAILKHY